MRAETAWRYSIASRIPQRIAHLFEQKEGGASPPRPITPSSGALCDLISARDALLEPIQHFLLDPSDSALAKPYPFRERPCRFKPGDMLRGIENKFLELTLRQYPHRGISS
jgi:hypothetical protein